MYLLIAFLRSLLSCLLPDGFPSCCACGPCCRQLFHLDIHSSPVYCRLFVGSFLNSAPWSPRGLYVSGLFCTKGCSLLLCADYSWISIVTPCSPPLSFALLTSSKSLLMVLVLALSLTLGKGKHCCSSGQLSSLLPPSLQYRVPTMLLVQPYNKFIQLTSPAENIDPFSFPCYVSAGLMSCVGSHMFKEVPGLAQGRKQD